MDESRMQSIVKQAKEGQSALDEAEERAAEMADADGARIKVSRDRVSVHLHFRNDD
jgi:hypothetical protein